jgi:predicted SPOUT superfamily RNA methylase MTH1
VTVRLNDTGFHWDAKFYSGSIVSQTEPQSKQGLYWGYNVRVAYKIEDVFDESPFENGYDLKIGISDKGQPADYLDVSKHHGFKHSLVFFGGMEGIQEIVEQDERTKMSLDDLINTFDLKMNSTPERGTRSVRTEENVLVSLAQLQPIMRRI